MISNVKGEFRNFNAFIEGAGEDFSQSKVNLTVEAGSIDTNNSDRDTHLRSADFFDVDNYPEITFEGTALIKLDEDNYQLKGLLGMKDASKEVILDVEFGGFVKDPYGNEKAGFSINGKLNRKEWGLTWNAALEAGGVMVSDEVRINAEIQFVRQ